MDVKVTRIVRGDKGNWRGFASVEVTMNDEGTTRTFLMESLPIMQGPKGLFVSMPRVQDKKDPSKWNNIFSPDKTTDYAIRDAVLAAYEDPNFQGTPRKNASSGYKSNASKSNEKREPVGAGASRNQALDEDAPSGGDEDIPF